MLEFAIRLGSVQDVQDFVAIATTHPFSIIVRDEHNKVKAESFMELFCLNFSRPLRVVCDCSESELEALKQDLSRFDLSSVQHASIAGEALNPEVFNQFKKATGLSPTEYSKSIRAKLNI
mgnify:CR=1 FL=1